MKREGQYHHESTHMKTSTDQTNGDLLPFIQSLLPHFPCNGGTMPIDTLLEHLQRAAPEVFAQLDRFTDTARVVCNVNETMALQWKAKGNQEFARHALSESLISYTHGLLCAETDETIATLLNNRSTVFFSMHRYADACVDADRALQYNPHYLKALQRRGRSLELIGLASLGANDVAASTSPHEMHKCNSRSVMDSVLREITTGFSDKALPPQITLLNSLHIITTTATTNNSSSSTTTTTSSTNNNSSNETREKSILNKGIIASDAIPSGTVLEEQPYALTAKMETMLTSCAYCLQYTQCLYHGDDYRKAKCKSRGFFCSKACAYLSWQEFGQFEHNNPFYLCCPNDVLLASRLIRGCQKYPELTSVKRVEKFDIPIASTTTSTTKLITTNEEEKHYSPAEVNNNCNIGNSNESEEERMTFGASLINSLDAHVSRELEESYNNNNSNNSNNSLEYSVGGAESIVTAIGLYMKAFDSVELVEHIRRAQRQILTHAVEVTCLLQMNASVTELHKGSIADSGNKEVHNNNNEDVLEEYCNDRNESSSERFIAHSNTVISLGKAMYTVLPLLRHSCDPNCYLSFYNNPQCSSAQVVLRAIRPIAAHEELTISYKNINRFTTHSTRHRQQLLRSQFGINKCTCHWCKEHPDDLVITEEDKAHYVRAADYYHKGKRMIQQRDYHTALTVLWQSYEIIMKYICPAPRPPQMMLPKTHNALALAYFYLHNNAKCVEHLEAELETDKAIHQTDVRPEMINNYTRLAFMSDDANKKQIYCERAVELLKLFYAPSSSRSLQIAYTQSSVKTK